VELAEPVVLGVEGPPGVPSTLPAAPEAADGAAVDVVRSFLRALGRCHTYSPRNLHAWFGFAWGLPIPVVSTYVHLAARGEPFALRAALAYVAGSSFSWWMLCHPLLFFVVFGAIGTVARDRAVRIAALVAELRTLAQVDGLTGLRNHRAFHEELRSGAQGGDPIGLVMIDVDHFKAFNDRHGHPRGDALLRALAQRLVHVVRGYDQVYRYGGEEFAVILPRAEPELVRVLAERLCNGVATAPLRLEPGVELPVTVSVGAACRRPGEPLGDWISRTDALLYAAKRAGRNRVMMAGDEGDPDRAK